MNQLVLNVLFESQNSEEITLKSEHNLERENKVLLLMTNDDEKRCFFDVKRKLELYWSEWFKSEKNQ